MALNREQILSLNVNDGLVEEYLVELLQNKHSSSTFKKQLEAALTANDELHAEVNSLREQLEAAHKQDEDVVQGEVTDEEYPVEYPVEYPADN